MKKCIPLILFWICMGLSVTAAEGPIPQDEPAAPSSQRVRVGFFIMPGYHNQDTSGVRSGYGYDYLQSIRYFTNWEYEYSDPAYSWPEMLSLLESGEIDLLTGVQKTPEREKKFAFSKYPLGEFSTILTVKAGNQKYLNRDYAHWNGIRVGLLQTAAGMRLLIVLPKQRDSHGLLSIIRII